MAWNEPGKQSSPPDLDEALRKMQQKLTKMFGSAGKGGTGPSKVAGGIGIGLIAIIALLVWALSGIFIIHPAEEAVVLRFGQYVKTVGPGPHWIPRFIATKYILNVQKVSDFSYTASMLTKDENIVSVAVAVQYRINNPNDYLFSVVNPRESLQQATASALRQVIGHTSLDDVLTKGREEVRRMVKEQLIKILSIYNTGIEITDVVMQPAKAPDEVKAAFDDAIKAQEDEQRFINHAQAYVRGVEPIAKGQAERITKEAQAYKIQVILQSKGNVARFQAIQSEYARAPEVTRERLYLDAMESVLTNTNKVIVGVEGSNNMLYLPLDRIMKEQLVIKRENTTVNLETQQEQPLNLTLSRLSERPARDSYRGRGGNP